LNVRFQIDSFISDPITIYGDMIKHEGKQKPKICKKIQS